jgi:hypothetical protein
MSDTSTQNNEPDQKIVKVVETIFKNAQLYILAIFLVVYLLVSLILGSNSSNTFDIVIFTSLSLYLGYKYIRLDGSGREKAVNDLFTQILEIYDSNLALFSVMLFVASLYVLLFILRVPTGENKPWSFMMIEGVSWFLLSTLIIHMSLKHFFQVDVMDYLREPKDNNIMDESGNVVSNADDTSEVPEVPEVFNISKNMFTFQDAQAVCQSMDARLATYDEVETAYNNGAEWCNYGWSADQLALFPTQKDTWNKTQGNLREKNRCGRPGINGGYFMNPNIKFGANCFGIKRQAKDTELKWLEAKKNQPYPKTKEQGTMDKKVDYWKENANDIVVNSFNKDKWSRY